MLAALFGWWLATGNDHTPPERVVELEVPPKGSTASARDPLSSADRGEEPSVGAVTSRAVASADPVVDPALVEQGASGPLPRIADDGRQPWRAYAGAFDGRDDRPRLAVIVTGLGLKSDATRAAIEQLPGPVTLALSSYAQDGERWATMARRHGHEILLSLPLESADFPFEDPGPHALLSTLSPLENRRRLEFLLSRFTGYVGVVGVMGSKFSGDDGNVHGVLLTLRDRGLMYVEGKNDGTSVAPRIATDIGLPRARVDLVLDDVPSAAAIDGQLARLEEIARAQAAAMAIARAYPVTLERLSAWAATLDERDLVLAPASAVADVQFLP